MNRLPYDGVVLVAPVSVPYVRYTNETAHWWIARALREVLRIIDMAPQDLDGLSVSSFTLAPDTPVGLTQHLGISPRWLDTVPMGGRGCRRHAPRRARRSMRRCGRGGVRCGRHKSHRQFSQPFVRLFAVFDGCNFPLRLWRPERQLCAAARCLHAQIRRHARRFRADCRVAARQRIDEPTSDYEKAAEP